MCENMGRLSAPGQHHHQRLRPGRIFVQRHGSLHRGQRALGLDVDLEAVDLLVKVIVRAHPVSPRLDLARVVPHVLRSAEPAGRQLLGMLERLASPTVEKMQPRGAQEPQVNQRQTEVPFVMNDRDVHPLLEPQASQSEQPRDAALRIHQIQVPERPPEAAELDLTVKHRPLGRLLQPGAGNLLPV